eukprot:TRINITY_DN2759_c0_g1_i6.p1 TRINITY_DN2759_c0_g1~~TRINITY_DN2759_c0_g1_i6.p1  ORF type:complete len:540 (-),score=82.42 TRINITY_DN2759_c0_g1_i6:91-1710(-)
MADANENTPLLAKTGATDSFRCDVFGLFAFLHRLKQAFGHELLILLFLVQHVLKGFANDFTVQANPYLFRFYEVPAPKMQILTNVSSLPWALKPAIGLFSDIVPIAGLNKAPYFLLTSAFGAAAYFIVGTSSVESLPLSALVLSIFVCQMQTSTCDLLSEATYAKKVQENPAYGPDLITYVWFGMSVATLLAAMFCGLVISLYGPRMNYLLMVGPAFIVIVPIVFGYLGEKRLTTEEIQEVRESFKKQAEVCFLCFLMFVGTMLLACVGLSDFGPRIVAAVSICVACSVVFCATLVLSPVLGKFVAFSVFQSSVALDVSGAAFYFYTDTPEQYPEGPHFSPFFYNTIMGVAGAVCSLVGIYFYNRYLKTWRYRSLIILCNVAFSVLCMLDVIMFRRLNLRLGIPDHHFVLGSSVLQSVVMQWLWMPQVIILSYLCPHKMEATMYALLAGCANLGSSISSNCGALMLESLGCGPNGAPNESGEFQNLWIASAISTILPGCSIVLTFWLVPDAQQDENLVDANSSDAKTGDATTGSWWRGS